MAIVDGCPAFSDGCPFSKTDAELLPGIMETMPHSIKQSCPAFKEGCPFKENDSVETLYNKLSDMPSTHQPNLDTPAARAVEETLRLVHRKSVELKAQLNTICPVFTTSCPFKTVTTYGAPLVVELDTIVECWGLANSLEGVPSARLEGDAEKDPEAIPAEPLSKVLKAGTKLVHRSAENVHFVRDFLKGSVKKESYIELLRALYHVYHAMEVGLRDLPNHLKHCDFSILERADALAADLSYYLGTPEDEAVDVGQPSPATKQYLERVQYLSREDPLLLLAHAYTRYLGDLSGGQILARAAEKAYGLPSDTGVSFYKFDRVGHSAAELKAFKKAYRSSLDSLQLSACRADDLVKEAGKAFLMNILVFEERDVAAGYLDRIRTIDEISVLVDSNKTPLEFKQAYGTKSPAVVAQCPFIPGAAGQRKEGESSFHGDEGEVCPWPFVWLHDPKSATVSHPVKNVAAFVGTVGLLRVAWKHPQRAATVFLGTAALLPWMKPAKKGRQAEQQKGGELGENSAHGDEDSVCPWPFVWLHDPKSAIVSHPVKNVAAFVGTLGLLRVAWKHPQRAAAVFLGTAAVLPWLKPKGNGRKH